MGDLVLGLLVLGAVLFAGVLVYNRVQERSVRRAVEQTFDSGQSDALFEAPPARREPALGRTTAAGAAPDDRVDYVIEVTLPRPMPAAVVREHWLPIEQRFGRRVLLGGADAPNVSALRAAMQLVSRAGVVSDAELIEFRSEVENLAAGLGASVSAPEMRQALETARELDRTCADSDIQVALHVVGEGISADLEGQPFQIVRQERGVTLVLDVALTPDLGRSYEAMVRAGRSLAESHGGRLVDDDGNALDERSLAAIGAQLEAVRQTLAGRGIETGSPLALRLFS
jgi:hypothetical protein